MRIKLKNEQIEKLTKQLTLEVIIEDARDVRGMLDLIGQKIPWEEMGLNKMSDIQRRPPRATFSVENAKDNDGYICDIHPALAQYLEVLLTK